MTLMRQAGAIIIYNGQNITISLQSRTGGFTYNDPESGSSDDCSLTIHDPDDKWMNGMFPRLGDKLIATIYVEDWTAPGDYRTLMCGSFVIDDPGFSGPPTKIDFKGVSKPADTSFTTQERTQTWENVTVQNMAAEIAGRYGLALQYTADPVQIEGIEQSGQPDSDFLKSVCEKYGLSLKIYSNRLVIFDREMYKQMPPVFIIDKGKMTSWSYKTTLEGTYSGGTMKYTDPDSGEEIEAKVGDDRRLLSVNGKADNQADAEKQIKAEVNKANESQETLSIKIPGNPSICSSQTVMITGLGVASGKYYVTKASHSIGGKYETSLELSKVQPSI